MLGFEDGVVFGHNAAIAVVHQGHCRTIALLHDDLAIRTDRAFLVVDLVFYQQGGFVGGDDFAANVVQILSSDTDIITLDAHCNVVGIQSAIVNDFIGFEGHIGVGAYPAFAVVQLVGGL